MNMEDDRIGDFSGGDVNADKEIKVFSTKLNRSVVLPCIC